MKLLYSATRGSFIESGLPSGGAHLYVQQWNKCWLTAVGTCWSYSLTILFLFLKGFVSIQRSDNQLAMKIPKSVLLFSVKTKTWYWRLWSLAVEEAVVIQFFEVVKRILKLNKFR